MKESYNFYAQLSDGDEDVMDEETNGLFEGVLLKVLVRRKEKWMRHVRQRKWTICVGGVM